MLNTSKGDEMSTRHYYNQRNLKVNFRKMLYWIRAKRDRYGVDATTIVNETEQYLDQRLRELEQHNSKQHGDGNQ